MGMTTRSFDGSLGSLAALLSRQTMLVLTSLVPPKQVEHLPKYMIATVVQQKLRLSLLSIPENDGVTCRDNDYHGVIKTNPYI